MLFNVVLRITIVILFNLTAATRATTKWWIYNGFCVSAETTNWKGRGWRSKRKVENLCTQKLHVGDNILICEMSHHLLPNQSRLLYSWMLCTFCCHVVVVVWFFIFFQHYLDEARKNISLFVHPPSLDLYLIKNKKIVYLLFTTFVFILSFDWLL